MIYSSGKGQAALSKGHRNHSCSCIKEAAWDTLCKRQKGEWKRNSKEWMLHVRYRLGTEALQGMCSNTASSVLYTCILRVGISQIKVYEKCRKISHVAILKHL